MKCISYGLSTSHQSLRQRETRRQSPFLLSRVRASLKFLPFPFRRPKILKPLKNAKVGKKEKKSQESRSNKVGVAC